MEDAVFKKIDRVVGGLIRDGKERFAIFPFGKRGSEVKWIINSRYGVTEEYIVDNSGLIPNAISLEDFAKLDLSGITILLCSDNEEIYNIIREDLYNKVPKTIVKDIFSYSILHDPDIYHTRCNFDEARVGTLEMVSREIEQNDVKGSLAEVGVYKGDFSKWILRFMPNRKMFLFDTFEGFDNRDISEKDHNIVEFQRKETFKDTSVHDVLNNIGRFYSIEVRKGYFPETATQLNPNEKFAFVSLDTDLYQPTKNGLEFFWPRMSEGGYIFVHDYTWGRVRDAVLEFCQKEHVGYVPLSDYNHTVALVKSI